MGLPLTAEDLTQTPDHALWRCNVAAFEAFLTMTTQWNMIARADGPVIAVGLNYAGARAALDLAGITATPALWSDVQVIEQGARAAMNEGIK